MTDDHRIPALIIGGWLGSGKTTLVGHLLEQARAEGIRLAIISNEFGETGIDRALLDDGQEGYVELDGGCVCCRLSDSLGETIAMVVARARPDRLVLECSGVALPGEVRLAFWRDPVDALISDETVVVVVDGDHIARRPLDDTFVEQVEAADLLLLNKCDLLDAEQQAAVEARLAALSAGRPVLRTVRSDVAAEALFPPDLARPARDPDAVHPAHDHARFDTWSLDVPEVLDEEAVIALVLAQAGLRAKGFVRTPGGVRVVQGVGDRVEISEPRVPPPDALVGRIVVIGHV